MLPPKNFKDLFKFYNDYVKLLYSEVQLTNSLPIEVLFELNAAFDHITRRWTYDEEEETVVRKAYSHLKRSCLDIFKIKVKEAIDQFDELNRIDISIINNGNFQKDLIQLINEIKLGAIEARRLEGDKRYDDDDKVQAFDRWQPVYEKCKLLNENFYLNQNVDWAKGKEIQSKKQFTSKTFWISVIGSFIGGIVIALIFRFFR